MSWTDLTAAEKREQVRPLIEGEGWTYEQAGQHLGVSRLAVAGVVERSSRSPNPIRASERTVRANGSPGGRALIAREKARKARKESIKTGKPMPAWGDDGRPLLKDVWLPLPGSRPVPLQMHVDGCRWPIGEDRPFLSCNNPVKESEPYCTAHAAVANRPLPTGNGPRPGLKVIGIAR